MGRLTGRGLLVAWTLVLVGGYALDVLGTAWTGVQG